MSMRFFNMYNFEKIFRDSIGKYGYIPPMCEWRKIGISQGHTKISEYLGERYPNVPKGNRVKVFLEDIEKGLSLHMKRNNRRGWTTLANNFKEIEKMIEDLGRLPYAVEYKNESRNPKSKYNLIRKDRLFKSLDVNSFAEVLDMMGYTYISPQNSHYDEKLISWGFSFKSEDCVEIDGSKYKIDYALKLPEGNIWVEIDGSSHFSPNSVYHQHPKYRKGSTPEESYTKKRKRDETIDKYFNEKGIPLIRISHLDFSTMSKERFNSLIKAGFEGIKVRTYTVFSDEKKNLISKILNEGGSTWDVAEALGTNAEGARARIHYYKLNHLRKKVGR